MPQHSWSVPARKKWAILPFIYMHVVFGKNIYTCLLSANRNSSVDLLKNGVADYLGMTKILGLPLFTLLRSRTALRNLTLGGFLLTLLVESQLFQDHPLLNQISTRSSVCREEILRSNWYVNFTV